ncbi:LysR family transcriptional regulator [Roseibium album]|uniref:LysR family transcriptional regulator n=1 Tax=Roseibium album TaxID=311410 RepID=UPI002493A746|nr:LysR family transcriptional regulator [Roseibium album]
MELTLIKTFLAVAEAGSFRGASRDLRRGQPSISRAVQRLEDALGVSLFERKSTGVTLTFAGTRFAARARVFLREVELAAEEAALNAIAERGNLHVGLIVSLSLGPARKLVQNFSRVHDDVDIRMYEDDRSDLLVKLSHRQLDVVVAAGEPETCTGDGLLLAKEDVFIAVPAGHEYALRTCVDWCEIRDLEFVVSAREPGPEIHEYLVRKITDLGRSARVTRHHVGREGIMNLVGLGFGVSVVAEHWTGVRYPNVVFVKVGDEQQRVPFSLTWRPENDNPALRRFISVARVVAAEANSASI